MSLKDYILGKIDEVNPANYNNLKTAGDITSYRQAVSEAIAEGILNWFNDKVSFQSSTLTTTITPPPPASPYSVPDGISGIKFILNPSAEKTTLGSLILAQMTASTPQFLLFIITPLQTTFTPKQLDLAGKITNTGVVIASGATVMVIPPNPVLIMTQKHTSRDNAWQDIGDNITNWVSTWTSTITASGTHPSGTAVVSGTLTVNISP